MKKRITYRLSYSEILFNLHIAYTKKKLSRNQEKTSYCKREWECRVNLRKGSNANEIQTIYIFNYGKTFSSSKRQ